MFKLRSKKGVTLFIPGEGQVFPLEEVADPAFSKKMVGDGIGFLPSRGEILSPCDGEIVHIFPTLHAMVIKASTGMEVLMHLGIDTVDLDGAGFECFVKVDQQVKAGQKLVFMDLEYIKNQKKSLVCPLVITNMDDVRTLKKYYYVHGDEQDIAMKVVML